MPKVLEDAIVSPGSHPEVIPMDLFERVQGRIAAREKTKPSGKRKYPLSGLIFCSTCVEPLHAATIRRRGRKKQVYEYEYYVCSTYGRLGKDNPAGCGCFRIKADAVEQWLADALRKEFLGPGRWELVEEIKAELKADVDGSEPEVVRLRKQLVKLEREVKRLVKAIRTVDAPELLSELSTARGERDMVKAALLEAGRSEGPIDLDAEAERIASTLWEAGGRLKDADPNTLREVFQEAVSRMECHWEIAQKTNRVGTQLVGGKVHLKNWNPTRCLSSSWARRSIVAP